MQDCDFEAFVELMNSRYNGTSYIVCRVEGFGNRGTYSVFDKARKTAEVYAVGRRNP